MNVENLEMYDLTEQHYETRNIHHSPQKFVLE